MQGARRERGIEALPDSPRGPPHQRGIPSARPPKADGAVGAAEASEAARWAREPDAWAGGGSHGDGGEPRRRSSSLGGHVPLSPPLVRPLLPRT